MGLRRLRAEPLVAHQHQKIQESVAERLTPQGDEARLAASRKQFGTAVECIEIFANDGRIVERRAVVENERRYFDNGLSFINSAWGLVISATVRTHCKRPARPRSCATIMTLRTKGDRGDQCSFIDDPLA